MPSQTHYFFTFLITCSLLQTQYLIALLVFIAIYYIWVLTRKIDEINPEEIADQNEAKLERQRNFVRQMARDAFAAYRQHAWGQDALRPVTNEPYNEFIGRNSGWTILASMSTLKVMQLEEEFERCRDWVEHRLDLTKINRDIPLFDLLTDYVGGLLSCFALTEDEFFLEKAKSVADLIMPIFGRPLSLFQSTLNPKTSVSDGDELTLSSAAAGILELSYLFDLTQNHQYLEKCSRLEQFVNSIKMYNSLLPQSFRISPNGDLYPSSETSSVCEESKHFYFTLLKRFIQSNYTDESMLEIFRSLMTGIQKNMIANSDKLGLKYVKNCDLFQRDIIDQEFMDYESCYLGGMIGLSLDAQLKHMNTQMKQQSGFAKIVQWFKQRLQKHEFLRGQLNLAKDLVQTGYEASANTKTKLAPKWFFFSSIEDLMANENGPFNNEGENVEFYLNPELAESYFILWRLTHDIKYRNYAWELAQSIEKHCRSTESSGYSGILDVNQVPTEKTNFQEPHFLSATLKYIYLTFCDDDVMSLDKWVFNQLGHPLPISKKEFL